MRLNSLLVPIVLTTAALVLTSCTTPEEPMVNEEMTLAEAKRSTMEVERQIADLVPGVVPERIHQPEQGVLLTCSDDGGKRWTGQVTVDLAEPQTTTLLDLVRDHFAEVEGFEALREESPSGREVLNVRRGGSLWIVSIQQEGLLLAISSGSDRIRLTADEAQLRN